MKKENWEIKKPDPKTGFFNSVKQRCDYTLGFTATRKT